MTGVHDSSAATTDALLPCPFCGPGQSMVDPWYDDVAKRWSIGCGRCGASSGRSVHAEGSKEAAIKAWNTRGVGDVAQATLWPDIKQLHDAIAECIGREGLTYSGIRRAAKRVQELYAATSAAQPPAAPVEAYIYGGDGRSDAVETDADLPTYQDVRGILPRSSAVTIDLDELQSELTDSLKPQGELRPLCLKAAEAIAELRSRAAPQEARSREDIAKIIGGDIFHGSDDGVGPATRHARVEALKKADAILALSRPLLCAHGVKIGNTCVGCMGAATLSSQMSRSGGDQ
jgi:Lar family restriction alleviation protein